MQPLNIVTSHNRAVVIIAREAHFRRVLLGRALGRLSHMIPTPGIFSLAIMCHSSLTTNIKLPTLFYLIFPAQLLRLEGLAPILLCVLRNSTRLSKHESELLEIPILQRFDFCRDIASPPTWRGAYYLCTAI